jgi:hypothetical protein
MYKNIAMWKKMSFFNLSLNLLTETEDYIRGTCNSMKRVLCILHFIIKNK